MCQTSHVVKRIRAGANGLIGARHSPVFTSIYGLAITLRHSVRASPFTQINERINAAPTVHGSDPAALRT
jgi:hypothetical protein